MANEAFDRWWNSSKYMQVVYSGGAERQTALDAWNARALYLAPPTAQLEALRKERDHWKAQVEQVLDPTYLNKKLEAIGVLDLERRAETAEARVAELEAERDCYLPGLQLLATNFWKENQYQAYAQHVIDAAEQAARRVREGGKVDD